MTAKRPRNKQRLAWEQHAAHLAKALRIPEAELKRAIRQAVIRKTADFLIEKHFASVIQTAPSPQAEEIDREENELERRVHRDKAVFPRD